MVFIEVRGGEFGELVALLGRQRRSSGMAKQASPTVLVRSSRVKTFAEEGKTAKWMKEAAFTR